MKIERIELHQIALPLVHPFRTSFGVETVRPCILAAVHSEGITGWGECVAGDGPWYSSETVATAWHILTEFLLPLLGAGELEQPQQAQQLLRRVRGHPMARACLDNALWDWFAKRDGVALHQLLGGERQRVEVGVSIGIQPSVAELIARVDRFVDAGYRRVKLKIEPGWTDGPVGQLRQRYPDLLLMADANSAFTLDDVELLRPLDELGLLMIEQPLAHDDIADHARLQRMLQTPICLDESIHGVADAQAAIDLQACRIINMKQARVGGLTAARRIHDMSVAAGMQMWCGGMLETGIGRAINVHLATLPNFTLPGDISATERYYQQDIADPPFVLNAEDSTLDVPQGPGIGVEVRVDRIEQVRTRYHSWQR